MDREFDLTFEVILLVVLGLFMLLFGLLLFWIHTGDLPYNPDSTYGLFLVIVALQIMAMGKTPFGDIHRSWGVVILGTTVAVFGIIACFVPGVLTELIRTVVGMILLFGGILLFFQLIYSEKKARFWIRIPGVLRHLAIASGLLYLITATAGLITLAPGMTTDPQTAILLILWSIVFFWLAWCIREVSLHYPSGEVPVPASDLNITGKPIAGGIQILAQEAPLTLGNAILIVIAVTLILFGILLLLFNLGLLPYSSAGLGLLLVIIAIQMLALGNTPAGHYKRSWLLMFVGTLFAAIGIVACIVPGILATVISMLLGILNLLGGGLLLFIQYRPAPRRLGNSSEGSAPQAPPIVLHLNRTQTALDLVAITFGVSALLPGLISLPAITGILIVNGLLLFRLVHLFQQLP